MVESAELGVMASRRHQSPTPPKEEVRYGLVSQLFRIEKNH
jgi:hypothetical protein